MALKQRPGEWRVPTRAGFRVLPAGAAEGRAPRVPPSVPSTPLRPGLRTLVQTSEQDVPAGTPDLASVLSPGSHGDAVQLTVTGHFICETRGAGRGLHPTEAREPWDPRAECVLLSPTRTVWLSCCCYYSHYFSESRSSGSGVSLPSTGCLSLSLRWGVKAGGWFDGPTSCGPLVF